jgi:hypothetical protein
MKPSVPLCDVEMFGGLASEGEVFRKCRLSILGKPASVILYSKLLGQMKWKPVDTLRHATVTEHPDGSLTIEGESQELVNVVGLRPSESSVRWEVKVYECPNCS